MFLGMAQPSKTLNEKPEAKPVRAQPKLVAIARGEVGVLEAPLNSNRGPRIDQYNLTCGKDFLGAPYCASGARWCFYQIGLTNGIPGAWSPDWYKKERKVESQDVQVGDQALVYFPSMGRFAHTIACIETVQYRGSKIVEVGTIEFNSNASGGREGVGVFRRIRSADSVTFVRWN